MAEDVKENEMQGGVPVRLRGLKADDSSISPTMEEVTAGLPVATPSSKGLLSATKARYLQKTGVFVEEIGKFIKVYSLRGHSTLSAYITCGRIEGSKLSTYLLNCSLASNNSFTCTIKDIHNGSLAATFYYYVNGSSVDIYIKANMSHLVIGTLLIIERGGATYCELIAPLPNGAVEVVLE